ncbi:hypothetical protein K437DRAFT_212801, partial [Tilletiaria anomala UBC 951]
SEDILLDLMAYQRTFDGAYMRTALNELSYAVVILKLFQSSFYYIGLAMTLLALAFAVVAVQRSNLGPERQTDCHLHGVSHFKTAGNVVAFATLGALAVETAILCIILTM